MHIRNPTVVKSKFRISPVAGVFWLTGSQVIKIIAMRLIRATNSAKYIWLL